MTPFGLLFVGYALFHDYWLDHGTNVRFLPYAIIALSFYTGLDVMFAGLAHHCHAAGQGGAAAAPYFYARKPINRQLADR